jgi:hypothetical protein
MITLLDFEKIYDYILTKKEQFVYWLISQNKNEFFYLLKKNVKTNIYKSD